WLLPVAILAGGLATRLGPVAENVPKSLLELNGEPFIFHQLRLLKAHGVQRAVLCVGHLGEMIRQVVREGQEFGVELTTPSTVRHYWGLQVRSRMPSLNLGIPSSCCMAIRTWFAIMPPWLGSFCGPGNWP